MSTKTTFKRIALVAVAALGLGVISVAPSSAAVTSDKLVVTPVTTAAIAAGETATATVGVTFIASASTDTITVKASLAGYPAGGAATLQFGVTDSATGTKIQNTNQTLVSAGRTNSVDITAAGGAGAVFANLTINAVTAASAVAGTYTVLVYTTNSTTNAAVAVPQSFTFKVSAVVTDSDASSTSYIKSGQWTANQVVDSTVLAPMDQAALVATIQVTEKNASGKASEDITVYVTGPGYVTGDSNDTVTVQNGTKVRAMTITAPTAGDSAYIGVWADGTAGVSTITAVGADSGVVLAKKTITFSSVKPSTISVAVKKAYIAAGKTTPKVFAITVKDASGNLVTGATITGTRTDTTTAGKAIATAALSACAFDPTDLVYYCSATGSSVIGFGAAEYKITASDAATVETTVSTTASTYFSDVVAKSVTISAPATASVGDKITYTITMTDKNGKPVADTTYEGAAANQDATKGQFGGIVWNTTTVPTYTSTLKPFNAGETITTVSGVATVDVYMPVAAGTVTNTWVLAGKSTAPVGAIDIAIAGTTITTTTVVTNPGVDAATDAANEATDAANAATDAALAAADAADAATAAAQDASDAIASLSATVAKLVASLKAQITSLTNLVIKIQKKVRA